MDPWVDTQIRLADRQGLLQGHGLSPVQHKSTFMIEMRVQWEREKELEDRVRAALVAAGRNASDMFPDIVSDSQDDPNADVAEAEPTDLDAVDATSYRFTEHYDEAEAERLLAELMGDGAVSGSFTGGDL